MRVFLFKIEIAILKERDLEGPTSCSAEIASAGQKVRINGQAKKQAQTSYLTSTGRRILIGWDPS